MTSAPIVTAARAAGPDDAITPRAFKGDSVRVFGAGVRQADGLSDFVIDVRGYNALSLDVTTFGSPGATLTVEGLAGAAGVPVVLPDPNATQVGVSTSRIVDVVCGQPFAKLRLTGGTYTGGAGYVIVVTPYIAPGQISLNITSVASGNISQWGGAATTLGQKPMAASVPVVLPSDQGLALNLTQVAGAAVSLGQAAMAASVPVVVASNQSAVPVTEAAATSGAQSSATLGTASTTLLAANAARLGATIMNEGSDTAYVRLNSGAASTTVYTVQIVSGGYYEVPAHYTGAITARAASATGCTVRITELT